MGLFDGTPLERPVVCDACGRVATECNCPPAIESTSINPAKQSPRVRRERRRGKWATVVADLSLDGPALKQLAGELKAALSVGGGVTNGQIVLQGDHRDAVVERLKQRGYKAKPSGG